jgi:hypothetical protein
MLPETYPIQMTQKQMRQFIRMYDWMQKNIPYIPSDLAQLRYDIEVVFNRGCFIHKRLTVTFRISHNETETVCPDCSQERYRELKSQYPIEKQGVL